MPNDVADKAALKLPAPYVNQFQVLVSGSNIRVAFAESGPGGDRTWRSAVVMSSSEALELIGFLLEAHKTINPPPPSGAGLFGGGLINNTPASSVGILGNLFTDAGKKTDG